MRKLIKDVVEDIEDLSALDGVSSTTAGWVTRATRRDVVKDALSGTWLGHRLHPMLTDLPIGAWVMASVLDATAGTALSDLSDGTPLRVTAGGVPVVLVRHGETVYALSATCTHAGGPLDEGKVLGDGRIRCPWHGSIFRLADGEAVRGPAAVSEPCWEVKVDDGRLYVRSAAP